MKQRLAKKILSRMVRKGDAIKIYGKGKCLVAYRLYSRCFYFYRLKYSKDLQKHPQDWIDICWAVYYERFYKFRARICKIYYNKESINYIIGKTINLLTE